MVLKLICCVRPDSAPGISVQGAGLDIANGIYVRTAFKVGQSHAFQKRGTSLALLKRGEGLDWSLVDLDGQVQLSTEEDKTVKTINSIGSTFSPGKLRWNPYSATLYKVASTLNSGTSLLPPQLGWVVVDGRPPAPSMTLCEEESTRPERILAAAMPGKLLKRIAENSPTAAKMQASIHPPWRTAMQQSLPRVIRWGTLEISRARKQNCQRSLTTSTSLPDFQLGMELSAVKGAGETVLLTFSVILSRPSFHTEWGAVFDKQQILSTGRRIVSNIEPHTPFDRWNIWQRVRGRPEMCLRRGDQLLKQNGGWAYAEVPIESPEGFEELPGIEHAEGGGETMLVMEFGRFVQRPCPPQPPRMEPWEVGYGLRVEIDAFLAGPYEQDVIAWALILKEELPETASGSEALGKADTCWRAYNSESGKVCAVIHDVEVGAVMATGREPMSLLLAEGVKTGRTYSACLAMLTDAGWSAFSYPSRSVHVKERPGLMDGILSLVLPPEDEQMLMMSAISNLKKRTPKRPAVFFLLPSQLQPGFSTPIATQSTMNDPCELLSKRRLLKMPLVLPNGRPKGLHVAEEGGNTLLVVEEGSWQGKEHSPMLNLSSMSVPWRLHSGDFIVSVNGLGGAERMLQELNRNPPVLAMEVLRCCGGKKDSEEAHVFGLDLELDDHCQRLVSEIRTHGLLSSDAELASLLVGSRDDLIQNALEKAQKFKHDMVPKRPSDGAPVPEAEDMDNSVNVEAQRRLLVLRRFHMMETCAKEGEKGQLSEACRLLQWAMADASFSAAKLGQKIEEFKQFGGSAVRASAPAQTLLKRAIFQRELWHWRERLRSERRDLKEAVEQMVRMEIMDQEHTKRFPGRPMNHEDVEKIVQARNVLDRQVRQGRAFHRQLYFSMAEAEAVLNRNLHSASGQRKLSPEEEYARFNPERTLTVGKQKGWW
ncbi:unnamed protein product [Durusdinium trenchii]|uniref:Uncharacterized protein n=1 Tax=Durusdinium trenchii TaxID=1381693 RepID=A0ABP0HAB4_9DINO